MEHVFVGKTFFRRMQRCRYCGKRRDEVKESRCDARSPKPDDTDTNAGYKPEHENFEPLPRNESRMVQEDFSKNEDSSYDNSSSSSSNSSGGSSE